MGTKQGDDNGASVIVAGRAGRVCSLVGRELHKRGLVLAAAESCTGGLISHLLTNVPGSSQWFAGSVVAYADTAKIRILGLPGTMITAHGAVSREVVLAMARGVRDLLGTRAGIAVSGIAGPGGGSPEKPVGTVWMAWVLDDTERSERFLFSGTRLGIKRQAALQSLARTAAMARRL